MHSYSSPVRVAVAGATGYAGQELIALLAQGVNCIDGDLMHGISLVDASGQNARIDQGTHSPRPS